MANTVGTLNLLQWVSVLRASSETRTTSNRREGTLSATATAKGAASWSEPSGARRRGWRELMERREALPVEVIFGPGVPRVVLHGKLHGRRDLLVDLCTDDPRAEFAEHGVEDLAVVPVEVEIQELEFAWDTVRLQQRDDVRGLDPEAREVESSRRYSSSRFEYRLCPARGRRTVASRRLTR